MGTLILAKSEFSNGTERAEENLWEEKPCVRKPTPRLGPRRPSPSSGLQRLLKALNPLGTLLSQPQLGERGAGSLAPAPIKSGEVVLVC